MSIETTHPEAGPILRDETRLTDPVAAGEAIAIDETDRLIASDQSRRHGGVRPRRRTLGSIYNFMVDKVSGQAAYAVMSFGGFLGLGERFYPLPWKALTYVPERGGYVVGLSRHEVEAKPSFAAGENPWADPAYAQSLYGLYGFNYGL